MREKGGQWTPNSDEFKIKEPALNKISLIGFIGFTTVFKCLLYLNFTKSVQFADVFTYKRLPNERANETKGFRMPICK